jgi:hypothetical protein
MRGRVFSVLTVFLFTALPILADCSFVSRYSGQFRSTVYDVAVDSEGFAWLATGYGVQILETIPGRGYAPLTSVGLAGSTRVVTVSGNLAYAGSGSRVFVLRRNGDVLTVLGSFDAGGTVNDIVVTTYLFVATSNGIAHFDLVDPLHPVRTSVSLATSRPNVTSLALLNGTLYAADGDATVEMISLAIPALPQSTGSLESLARSAAVHTANNLIFVSDELGQNTDVFSGTTKLARIGYGSNAFAPLGSDSIFVAGPQRIFRALQIVPLTRVAELYEQQLLPIGGTNNRIFAMARSGNTLLVAAGDMGLVTYDIGVLISPHPLVSYADGGGSTVATIGDKAYFAGGATISEYAIARTGLALTPGRTWAATSPLLHDATATSLITSGNSELRVWDVAAATPTTTFTATLPSSIRAAVQTGNAIYTHLVDYSLWRVPTAGGAAEQITVPGPRVESIARSGNAVALVQVGSDANTTVRYYATGDLNASPQIFTLDGAAIGGIALNTTTAAVFTFRGVNLIDLASGSIRVLPSSARTIPKQLLFAGSDLLILGSSTLSVWDTTRDVLLREHSLPASASQMAATNGVAVLATGGATAIDYRTTLPKGTPALDSRFYRSASAAGNNLYLLEDGRIDIFSTSSGAAPAFITTVSAPGTNAIAALPRTVYAQTVAGGVTAYSNSGAKLNQVTIEDAVNAQSTAIFAVGDAVWASFFKGCTSGCVRTTVVLDPTTLAVRATMNGGLVDVVTSGTRAYALFEDPTEMRVIDISNPLQPSQLNAAASPANATDIAYGSGKVYVIADKVYAYNESLVGSGEFLDAVTTSQHIAIDGDCAVVTGRSENPQFFTLPSWTLATTQIQVPSPAKAIAQQPGRMFVLTDHSIEVWTTTPPPSPTKRRSAR